MKLLELITSKDGSLSVTKLEAATFHFLLALAVIAHTIVTGFKFDLAVWGFFATVAVGHATYDKTKAQNIDLEKKRLEAGTTA